MFTAEDVRFTLNKLLKCNGNKAGGFYETKSVNGESVTRPIISDIRIDDKLKLTIVLTRHELINTFLAILASIPIIPSGSDDCSEVPLVGTGPFKITRYDPEKDILELESNTGYWDGPPKIKRLSVKFFSTPEYLLPNVRSGQIDFAMVPSSLRQIFYEGLQGSNQAHVENFRGLDIMYLGLNTKSPPLKNALVRQAIAYAIDKEKVIFDTRLGAATPAFSILPEQSWAYTPGTRHDYDPKKARLLLGRAKYKREPIVLNVSSGNGQYYIIAQSLAQSLRNVGINVRVEAMEVNTLRLNLMTEKFQMNLGMWIGGNQDPLFLSDMFSSQSIPGDGRTCCNRSRYTNSLVDRLLSDANDQPFSFEAKLAYRKAWEMISSDVPAIPLWYMPNTMIVGARVWPASMAPSGDLSFLVTHPNLVPRNDNR